MMNEKKLGEGAVKIVLSNLEQPADMEKARSLGATGGFIVKVSSTPGEVVDKVKEIFLASKNQSSKKDA
jgi:hypothetical protein